MDKKRIMPEGFWDWPLPTTFSQGWRVGNLVFVGGQVSQTPDGRPLHPYDIEAQIGVVFDNIATVLAEAGCGLADIVKLNTYWVHDGDDHDEFYKHMTEIRHRYLPDPGPAATAVRVAGLAVEGLLIEIEAIAVIPDPATDPPSDSPVAARRVLADRTEFVLDADAQKAWEAINRRPARDLPGLRKFMQRPSPFVDE